MNKKTIVVIEDDNLISRVLKEELDDLGFRVITAFDGEEGLRAVQEERPDLVLLDIVMPKKDGRQVLHELKRADETKDIPVVMLTVSVVQESAEACLKEGALDYIIKSQHAMKEIVSQVEKYIK